MLLGDSENTELLIKVCQLYAQGLQLSIIPLEFNNGTGIENSSCAMFKKVLQLAKRYLDLTSDRVVHKSRQYSMEFLAVFSDITRILNAKGDGLLIQRIQNHFIIQLLI